MFIIRNKFGQYLKSANAGAWRNKLEDATAYELDELPSEVSDARYHSHPYPRNGLAYERDGTIEAVVMSLTENHEALAPEAPKPEPKTLGWLRTVLLVSIDDKKIESLGRDFTPHGVHRADYRAGYRAALEQLETEIKDTEPCT